MKLSLNTYSNRNATVPIPFYFGFAFIQITWPFFGPSYSISESQLGTPKKEKHYIKMFLNHNKYKKKKKPMKISLEGLMDFLSDLVHLSAFLFWGNSCVKSGQSQLLMIQ